MTGNALRQVLEVLVARPDRLLLGTDGAVRRPEEKHGLVGIHGQGHEAAIVLEQRQVIRVRCDVYGRAGGFVEHGFTVDPGDAIQPALIGLHGAGIAHAMLHDDIADGLHLALWHLQVPRRLVEQLSPDTTPLAQRRAQVFQPLQREQIRRKWHHHLIGGNQCRAVDGGQIGSHVDQHQLHRVPRRTDDQAVERRHDAEGRFIPIMAIGPGIRQLILEARKPQITGNQAEIVRDGLNPRQDNVPQATQDGRIAP